MEPTAEETTTPVNFQPRDLSAMEQDLEYALSIAGHYIYQIKAFGLNIDEVRLLELGPGINFGPQLILASMGAKVSLADRFLAPWDESYHPTFYSALAERWSGSTNALDRAVNDKGYQNTLTLIPEPAEMLNTVEDGAFDLVISNAVLEHVFDFPAVTREMARVTRSGGYNAHQIDFRDHRNFDRPLEFLLVPDEEFESEFRAIAGERGNRVRPNEAEALFLMAGFEIQGLEVNSKSTDEYLDEFIPRLRQSASSYRDWSRGELLCVGGRFRVIAANSDESKEEGRRKLGQLQELRRVG